MKTHNHTIFLWAALLAMILAGERAWAGNRGLHLSVTGMALTSSTEQGGQGPKGSTVLTHTDLFWNFSFWGLGMFFQYDIQGTAQTDIGFGPKLELHFGPFYFEGGYTASVQRNYTDRSIAKETGKGFIAGVGVRFSGGGRGKRGGGGWFFQANYRYRQQAIEAQDDVPLSEPIKQYDGYPTFGFGFAF